MTRVLLAYPLADRSAQDFLASEVEVVVARDAVDFRRLLKDVDGVIARPPMQLDAAALAAAPRLRVIANTGSGIDHVDVDAAERHGILVLSAPGLNARAVAEYVLAVMISSARRFDTAVGYLRSGTPDWGTRLGVLRGHELGPDATLGIVGFGHVGRQVAAMVRGALGMRVVVYDPFVRADAALVDAQCATLPELLAQSRVVTLHVPLTELTRGMVGAEQLALLGPECVLINTSRGAVVDDQAVIDVLRDGRLWAAAVDVFDPEPPAAERLAVLAEVPHLIVTPHIAGITYEAGSALAWRSVHDLLAALAQ
jgi:phosphoglycerate dehydrogenase-like enzyme